MLKWDRENRLNKKGLLCEREELDRSGVRSFNERREDDEG